MAEKIISPGVFTRENDLSFLPQGVGEIGAAIVGPTVKGPVGIPTQVTSYAQYVDLFGNTFKSGSDYQQYLTSHTAEQYLKNGGPLTVVRIAGDGFSHASSSVATGETPSTGTAVSGAFSASVDAANPFAADGSEVQVTQGSVEYRFIASDQVSVPVDNSPIFYFQTGSTVGVAVTNFVDKVNTVTALALTAVSGADGGVEFTASANGVQTITVQTGSGTIITNLVSFANGTNGATETAFKVRTLSEGDNLNNYQLSEGTNHVLESGSKDNVRWEVSNVDNNTGTFNLVVRRGNDSSVAKIPLETWSNLSLDPNSTNYISKVIGDMVYTVRGTTADPYLQLSGSYSNMSRYIRVEVLKQTVDYLDENGDVRVAEASQSLPTSGSGSFLGGADGNILGPAKFYENITSGNCQGYDLSSADNANGGSSYTQALNLLANQDEYDINMLLIPGANQNMHSAIVDKAVKVAEARGDCFAVVDPVGYGAAITTTVAEAAKYNSSYAAMYWPWVQIPDNQLNKLIWVPAGSVLPGVLAFNDKVAHEWYAPAGLNRGGVDVAVRAERKLTHTNRDTLYSGRINPLATFPGQGVVVWGQKTLQKKSSALDRVNVRRLLINLKKFIASTSKYLVFENNTNETRNRFLSTVVPYMERVQQNNGLFAFKVVMDDTNNTPDIIDRNIMKGDIYIQPAKAAEFIVVDFNVMPTGATFGE